MWDTVSGFLFNQALDFVLVEQDAMSKLVRLVSIAGCAKVEDLQGLR